MSEGFFYVLIESGNSPTILNNQLPSPIEMTEGEAEHANAFIQANDQTQRYIILEDSPENVI